MTILVYAIYSPVRIIPGQVHTILRKYNHISSECRLISKHLFFLCFQNSRGLNKNTLIFYPQFLSMLVRILVYIAMKQTVELIRYKGLCMDLLDLPQICRYPQNAGVLDEV